jgi:hypothetical protein
MKSSPAPAYSSGDHNPERSLSSGIPSITDLSRVMCDVVIDRVGHALVHERPYGFLDEP